MVSLAAEARQAADVCPPYTRWAFPLLLIARRDAKLLLSTRVPVVSLVLEDSPESRASTPKCFNGVPEMCGVYAVTYPTDCTCQEWSEWERLSLAHSSVQMIAKEPAGC